MELIYESMSDAKLISQLQSGDRLAFAEIYNRYKFVLYTHAYKWMRNREEAMDIIHEIFIYLWAKRKEVEFNADLSGYLYFSLRDRIFNRISKKASGIKHIDSLHQFLEKGDWIKDYLLREKLLAECVEKPVTRLPDQIRETFSLSRNSDLSHKEIAERLKLSEETVRQHILQALQALKSKPELVVFLFLLTTYVA